MSISEGESELSLPEEETDELPNIGLYIGDRNSLGERHGRGWAILPNGDQYDGQYRKGQRHGIGLYVFKAGPRYYGRYRCGHRSGRGIFIYPDGSMYEGNWRKSVKHGKGRYNYTNGDNYTGDWYKGIRHGVGIYTFNEAEAGCPIRFKGTWRDGVRVGPFEVYFGNAEKCTILHGTWDNMYPQGPGVFSFDQRYMLIGFFQNVIESDNRTSMRPIKMGEEYTEFGEGGEFEEDVAKQYAPSIWYSQDICVYDYSQLPQEPVPLPLSDSDISICSLSTVPTEVSVEKDFVYMDEGEAEEAGEMECIPECECDLSDIETESEPCDKPDDLPCAIDDDKPTKCK